MLLLSPKGFHFAKYLQKRVISDGQQVVFLFVRKSVDDPNMIGILSTAHAWSLETRKQFDNNKVKLNF